MTSIQPETLEKLAAIEHQRWSDWQAYLHGKCTPSACGGLVIPAELVAHWSRQIETPYADLSEAEKQSDRDQVARYMSVVMTRVVREFTNDMMRAAVEVLKTVPDDAEPENAPEIRTITGAAFRDFYKTHWPGAPGEVWHEDSEYEVEDETGTFIIADDAVLELRRLGYLHYGLNGTVISFEQAWGEHLARMAAAAGPDQIPMSPLEHLQTVMSHVDTPIGRRRLNIGTDQPDWLVEARRLLKDPASGEYQGRVDPWLLACFGEKVARDPLERGDRLVEEVLELMQATGYPRERVAALIDYTWSREKGEPHQEVGGVMVTLAAFCLAHGLDMHAAGEDELARVWTKVDKIREKQARKPTGSALPQAWPATNGPDAG